MKVIIVGGTGMIGRALSGNLLSAGYDVTVLSRKPKSYKSHFPSGVKRSKWDPTQVDGLSEIIEGSEAVINLVGENLAGDGFIPSRWSPKRKQQLIDSRLIPGKTLSEAIEATSKPPSVLIQASAVGYYGSSETEVFTEDSPPGSDFLATLCIDWENSTASVVENGVRRAVIRSAIVLDANQGALNRLIFPFKLFVGGSLGNGRQWFPWIHPIDEIRAIRFLLENETADGPFNLVAPNLLRNAELAKVIGSSMKRPSLIPVPGFALRIALGEVATMVLEGQRAIPKRLENLGFTFQFPDIEPALRDLFTG
jgi:uncharacterized protein (TIGR01777 family)